MRASVDFTVKAQTIDEVKEKALSEWKRVTQDIDAQFPPSTELRMQQSEEDDATYVARIIIQTKLGE
jgi:hypothetical protein